VINEYAKARNQAKKSCKQGVKQMEKDIATKIKHNPKMFWKYTNSKLKTIPSISTGNAHRPAPNF
jgi:hypothetical protein